MANILFTGWQPGFQKVPFNKLLRDYLGMSLSGAKAVVDSLLSNEHVLITTTNREEAILLLAQAQMLGVIGELEQEVTF